MFFLEFGINLVVAALLVITIGYCWTLNKRIRILQDSRSELAELLSYFDASTQKASDSIMALQAASKKIGETIQSRIEKANYVADDLNFLVERAEKLADKLEGASSAKPAVSHAPALPEMEQAKLAVQKAKAAVEEEERNKAPGKPISLAKPGIDRNEQVAAAQSLQSMLEKLAVRATSDPALRGVRSKAAGSQAQRPRSRAEQELLEIIKAGNKV